MYSFSYCYFRDNYGSNSIVKLNPASESRLTPRSSMNGRLELMWFNLEGYDMKARKGFIVIHSQSGNIVDVAYVTSQEAAEIYSNNWRPDNSYDFECISLSDIDVVIYGAEKC